MSRSTTWEEVEPEIRSKVCRTTNPIMTKEEFVKVGPGKCFLPKDFLEHYDSILNFEVRPNDIWLASFMKTGTTWLKELVWLVMNDLDLDKAMQSSCYSRFPNFENSATVPLLKSKHPYSCPSSMEILAGLPASGTRLIHTHLPWTLLPTSIQQESIKPKIIYITRNPLDVVVSYFHHRVLFEGFTGTMDDFVDLFVHDAVRYAPFWNHVQDFWTRRNQANVLFLTYEEMSQDLSSAAEKVSAFLGRKIGDDKKEKLMDHLSFENMKRNPTVNHEALIGRFINQHGVPRQSDFIRKGKMNAWKQELSLEACDKIRSWYVQNCIKGLWTDADTEMFENK